MVVSILSSCFNGIDGVKVEVEVDIKKGLPSFNIVGLGDTSIKEAKERVRAAIINSGYEFPLGRVTVNLAPADVRKEGCMFDLPIAIGVLAASNQIKAKDMIKYVLLGELSLNGGLKPIKGVLSMVMNGMRQGVSGYIVPYKNRLEAVYIKKAKVYAFNNLKEVINFLQYSDLLPEKNKRYKPETLKYGIDFSDVIELDSAKRAIEIAAAGGHNILMYGPPGSGKSMLAKRIPTILPQLSYEEALEVTRVYSIMGLTSEVGIIKNRPFRNPHHSITKSALIGGGFKASPGEISLAHNGVLFLDEILEFNKKNLDLLRQPLEDKEVNINRKYSNVKYPSNFMFVAAMNPCPCGYYGSDKKNCVCTINEINRYLKRLSGPIIDRFDIFINVKGSNMHKISGNKKGETSIEIKKRIIKAVDFQRKRYKLDRINSNACMNIDQIKKYCKLDEKANEYLKKMYELYNLSNRSYIRILKVSRTIADLNLRQEINHNDIIEAFQYRKFIEGKII